MLQQDKLQEFYKTEYARAAKRKLNPTRKTNGYEQQLMKLYKRIKREKKGRINIGYLVHYHREISHLLLIATAKQNQKLVRMVNEEMLPCLMQLDISMISRPDREELDEEFIQYAISQQPKKICNKTLLELVMIYKDYRIRKKVAELVPSRPEMEFPESLEMKRRFILHIGPTNSGKTYHALERLKDAKCGVYLGPLRLLALEVYEKMKEYGTPCTMLTGQECIEEPDSRVIASTIEMLDIDKNYDIAVIDEAQMIVDTDRGHSWTRAILGIKAKEIHICMSPTAEKVVTHLIELCHDTWESNCYERKTPLVCEKKAFVFPIDVRPGDALIVFSKKSVLDVAGRLEARGISSSVIYGSLPPEIRRKQMQLFNKGINQVVVSTDAIGMGLNLPVQRIVFIETEKFDGIQQRKLTISEVKQIAGRAGRFGVYDIGYVTAMGKEELEAIDSLYQATENPIEKVSLGFPQVLLNLPEPLDAILKTWHAVEAPEPFEKISIDEILFLYEKAEKNSARIDGFEDKHILYRMVTCPIDIKNPRVTSLWLRYCETYTADKALMKPNINQIHYDGIGRYETYYKQLELYYQFSERFGKEMDMEWLTREREKTEVSIMKCLAKGKMEYIATCRYCGRRLPVGYGFNRCEQCRKMLDTANSY